MTFACLVVPPRHRFVSSGIMPFITIDLDPALLRALNKRRRRERKSPGQLVSEMLAAAIGGEHEQPLEPFTWVTKPMHPLVDLEERDALRHALHEP